MLAYERRMSENSGTRHCLPYTALHCLALPSLHNALHTLHRCVMLLALDKKEFPVDTNVARVCARLGWIPLQSEASLEQLDQYPDEPEVHK